MYKQSETKTNGKWGNPVINIFSYQLISTLTFKKARHPGVFVRTKSNPAMCYTLGLEVGK